MGVTNSKLNSIDSSSSSILRKTFDGQIEKDIDSDKFIEILWFDLNLNETNKIYRNELERFYRLSTSIHPFIDLNELIKYLNENSKRKHFHLILTDILFNENRLKILSFEQISSIYILISDERLKSLIDDKHEKIKGIYLSIDFIYHSIQNETRNNQNNYLGLSLIQSNGEMKNANSLFFYWFFVKKILLNNKYSKESHHEKLVEFCRQYYSNNFNELKKIDEFEKTYFEHSAIWWFTQESFIYRMLNRAFQTEDIEIFIIFSSFLFNLHQNIQEIQSQIQNRTKIVYRNQLLSKEDFEKIQNSQGNYLSLNNFFLADENENLCLKQARLIKTYSNQISILFRLEINLDDYQIGFVPLENLSFHSEQNHLFLISMHSIYKIQQIQFIEDRLVLIHLKTISSQDKIISYFEEFLQNKNRSFIYTWENLAQLMTNFNDFQRAKDIYFSLSFYYQNQDLLKLAHIYNQLGLINDQMGEYSIALYYYQKSIEIRQKHLPPNHRLIGIAYNNLGEVQRELGEYMKSLASHKKTLSIKQKILPANDLSLAITYNNLGLVNGALGDFSSALQFYQKSLEIKRKVLSPTHIDLANTYNNLGELHREMGNYTMSLNYFEKALKIREKNSSTHHDSSIAINYNNLGLIYREMGDYNKAIEYFQKSLQVKLKIHKENHPSIALTYNNMGDLNQQIGNFSQALNSYTKALDIQEKIFHSNHPDLAITYNNIGVVHQSNGNYSMALHFFDKALKIRQKSLNQNHPSIGTSFNNIGHVYQLMGNYQKSLEFYEKTLKIQEKTLHQNHPSIAITYNNIAEIHRKLENYQLAIQIYKKVLHIKKQSLPNNHPSLITTYNNIGVIHQSISQFPLALEYFQKALVLQEKLLSDNHPDLAAIHNNIGATQQSMKAFTDALRSYKKALDIQEKSLSEKHPDKSITYNSIATVYVDLQDYQKALTFAQMAVDIASNTLPNDHPNRRVYEDYLHRIIYQVNQVQNNNFNQTSL